jgi:hypothetical protein
MVIAALRPKHRPHLTAQPTLDQQLEIHRTRLVPIETILEGVVQRIQTEMPAASGISSIQKRTMMRLLAHVASTRPQLSHHYRQRANFA